MTLKCYSGSRGLPDHYMIGMAGQFSGTRCVCTQELRRGWHSYSTVLRAATAVKIKIFGSVYSSGSRTANLLAIRPAVWYTEYIYRQYTVALELRIFKDFVFNYIVEKKAHEWGSNPGLPTLQSSVLTVRPSCNTPDIGSCNLFKSDSNCV